MEVSIIGSGTMATGILQVLCLSSDVSTINLIARTEEKALVSKENCGKNLSRLSRKGKIDDGLAVSALNKINCSSELSCCSNSDFVLEAVSENFETKMSLFSQLAKFINDFAIVASNTSSLSITAFASSLPNPRNVVGLHFFNPAPVMELVEIVAGYETSNDVIDYLVNFTKSLGKSPIVVKEAPGFVVNRMLIPMINEAIGILAEGVASAEANWT